MVINRRVNVDNLKEQFTTTTFIFALACNSMHPAELFFKANKKYMWGKINFPEIGYSKTNVVVSPFMQKSFSL